MIAADRSPIRLPGLVRWALDCMEIAEEEVAAAKAREPEKADRIHGAFGVLCPRPELFRNRPGDILRAHIREMIRRVAAGADPEELAAGTAVECCMAFSELSLRAPLQHRYAVAYQVAFLDAFGAERAARVLGDEALRRLENDRELRVVEDALAKIRHHMRDPQRAAVWKEKLRERSTDV